MLKNVEIPNKKAKLFLLNILDLSDLSKIIQSNGKGVRPYKTMNIVCYKKMGGLVHTNYSKLFPNTPNTHCLVNAAVYYVLALALATLQCNVQPKIQ